MNGLRHCASKVDANGCVDSCYMGREWKAAGGPYGGSATATPTVLSGFLGMDGAAAQCDLVNQANTSEEMIRSLNDLSTGSVNTLDYPRINDAWYSSLCGIE